MLRLGWCVYVVHRTKTTLNEFEFNFGNGMFEIHAAIVTVIAASAELIRTTLSQPFLSLWLLVLV